MESKGLMQQDLHKKSVPITEGGIKIERKDDQEELKNKIMGVPKMMELPKEMNAGKEKNLPDLNGEGEIDEEEFLRDLPVEQNKELIDDGIGMIGKYDEKEIDLNLGDRLSIRSFVENPQPVIAKQTRFRRFAEYPQIAGKNAIQAGQLLGGAASKVVKRGAFNEQMLETGRQFMDKINKWAGIKDNPAGDEGRFNKEAGTENTIDCLYVDGMPIREFVAEQYGYRGSRDKAKEREILGAYAAMIAARQNHPLTLVRPVIIDGAADVEIRNVAVSTLRSDSGRSKKIKNIGYALNGKEKLEYCKSAYRSDMRAKAGRAMRKVKGKEVMGLNKLQELKERLQAAGKGRHNDYDEFVRAFNNYNDAMQYIGLDPDNMEISAEELSTLYGLCGTVIKAAVAYLKGKKMNLPRHNAVKAIHDLLSVHSGSMWGVIRGGSLNEEGATVSLKELLDHEERGFVVFDTQEKTAQSREKQRGNENDKNEYTSLEKDIELSRQQKTLRRLKNLVDQDRDASLAFTRLRGALDKADMPEELVRNYALVFLKAASNAIAKDERTGATLRRRFGADTPMEELLNKTAHNQLTKMYEQEFKTYPVLGKALDEWDVQLDAANAVQMSYSENMLGNAINKADYEMYGGASRNLYVTDREAKQIVKNSKGFLCAKDVEGHKGLKTIRPSMPEKVKITNNDGSEEEVLLRKTMNLMFKTMVYMTTNEDGTVKNEVEMFDGTAITDIMDQLFRELNPGQNDDTAERCANFMHTRFQPAMEEMLTAEYRKKGMNRSEARYMANNDSIDACNAFFKLIDANTSSFVQSPDVAIHYFRCTGAVLRGLDRQEFINSPQVKSIRINGEAPSPEEIGEALDEFMQELEAGEAELKKIRDMDSDSEETPAFNSCIDSKRFQTSLMAQYGKETQRFPLEYAPKNSYKSNPGRMIDFLLDNLDKMCDLDFNITAEDREKKRKKLLAAKEQLQKEGKLNMAKRDDLRDIYDEFAKYNTHQGAYMSKTQDSIITIETYANNPDELIHAPITMSAYIGKYRSQKPGVIDNGSLTMEHEGFTHYYSNDDYFAHIKTRKSILKTNLKQILSKMIVKKSDSEIA